MPSVRKGEKKKDYMSRCIPHVRMKNGVSQRQAWHVCNAIWRKEVKEK